MLWEWNPGGYEYHHSLQSPQNHPKEHFASSNIVEVLFHFSFVRAQQNFLQKSTNFSHTTGIGIFWCFFCCLGPNSSGDWRFLEHLLISHLLHLDLVAKVLAVLFLVINNAMFLAILPNHGWVGRWSIQANQNATNNRWIIKTPSPTCF